MTKKQLERENRILRKIIMQGQPYNRFERLFLIAKDFYYLIDFDLALKGKSKEPCKAFLALIKELENEL